VQCRSDSSSQKHVMFAYLSDSDSLRYSDSLASGAGNRSQP
jgi:hypothetical protein